jgi:pimeloyl-ACP methyl ester carboxylesterase
VGVAEQTIEVTGASIFCRRTPVVSGVTPLYLHSVPTSSDDWLTLLEDVGGVAPDLPGFGRSSKAANLDLSIDGYVEFVADLIAELELDQVTIVGHGWGGAIGLLYAERHPEHVARLALIDPVPLLEQFRWPRFARRWRWLGIGELSMGAVARWMLVRSLRTGAVSRRTWPDERIDQIWEQFDQGTQRAILRLHRSVDAHIVADAEEGLDAVRAPALIVWGEQDPWLPASFADTYGQRLPDATVLRVPGAGHWPWLEDADVRERVARFIADGE